MEVDICEYNEDIQEAICYDDHLRVLPVIITCQTETVHPNIPPSPFQNIRIDEGSNYYFRYRDLSGNHGKKLKRGLSQPEGNMELDSHECDNQIDNSSKERHFRFEHIPADKHNIGDRFKFTMTSKNLSKLQQAIPHRPMKLTTLCYICQGPDFPGKFDPSKAATLGLKKGPKYSMLTKGQPVESDDGTRIIQPADCIGPSTPGKVFLVVDCPTLDHFHSILSKPIFEKYSRGNSQSEHVAFAVHLTPPEIFNTQAYQDWLAKIGNSNTQVSTNYSF